MIKVKNIIPDFILCLIFGITLGIISKYLDTVADDGSWWRGLVTYFGNLFTGITIWMLISTIIAASSKTLIKAAINTFLFLIGMLISYYIYSAYLFGFFPTSYFIYWLGISLFSPILAIVIWNLLCS